MAVVSPILHNIIPILIQSIKRPLGASKATPRAVPSQAPNNNGEDNPNPIKPYLFHI